MAGRDSDSPQNDDRDNVVDQWGFYAVLDEEDERGRSGRS